jgi:lipoprotein NlpD
LSYSNDSYNGVKPIGLIIKGRSGGEILSSAAGIVKKIGYMRGFGNYIVLVHTGRFSTVYSRVGKVLVGEGESIHAGVAIGIIDNNTDILHFQIDYEGKPANPLKFLPPRS